MLEKITEIRQYGNVHTLIVHVQGNIIIYGQAGGLQIGIKHLIAYS